MIIKYIKTNICLNVILNSLIKSSQQILNPKPTSQKFDLRTSQRMRKLKILNLKRNKTFFHIFSSLIFFSVTHLKSGQKYIESEQKNMTENIKKYNYHKSMIILRVLIITCGKMFRSYL